MQTVIGQNIKNLRTLHSWTQEHLAEAAQVTSRTVQRVEAGEPISAESLQAIAGALNATIEDLRRDQAAEDLKTLMAQYTRVDMSLVREGPELLQLMPVDALLIQANGTELAVKHADAIARLRDALTAMVDIWTEAPASHHLGLLRCMPTARVRCTAAVRESRRFERRPRASSSWWATRAAAR